ncbi:unnamed protein product [Pedinophyceae sp. YPF-701]|nr:unnamed protein product [Pedinophyceae sp. YPF-701]
MDAQSMPPPEGSIGDLGAEGLDEKATTLLESFKQALESEGKTQLIGRLCLVSKTREKQVSTAQLTEWHQRILEASKAKGSPGITGLLLIWPTCAMLVVEGKFAELSTVAHHVERYVKREQAPVLAPKIACLMDDIPERAFSWFESAFIPNAANDTVEQLTYDLCGEALSELAVQITALGKQLTKIKSTKELKTALASLQTFASDLPQADRIVSLQESPDTLTLTEFLSAFQGPLDPVFDSEITWPPSASLPL